MDRPVPVLNSLQRCERIVKTTSRDLEPTLQAKLNVPTSKRIHSLQPLQSVLAFVHVAGQGERENELSLNLERRPSGTSCYRSSCPSEYVVGLPKVELDSGLPKLQEGWIVHLPEQLDQAASRRLVVFVARNADAEVDDEGVVLLSRPGRLDMLLCERELS